MIPDPCSKKRDEAMRPDQRPQAQLEDVPSFPVGPPTLSSVQDIFASCPSGEAIRLDQRPQAQLEAVPSSPVGPPTFSSVRDTCKAGVALRFLHTHSACSCVRWIPCAHIRICFHLHVTRSCVRMTPAPTLARDVHFSAGHKRDGKVSEEVKATSRTGPWRASESRPPPFPTRKKNETLNPSKHVPGWTRGGTGAQACSRAARVC